MLIVIITLAMIRCCVTSELSEPAPQAVDDSGSTGPDMSFSERCFGLVKTRMRTNNPPELGL